MDTGTSGDLVFSILKSRPVGWQVVGGLIRRWKCSKALVLLVVLEFICIVSDTNYMNVMTHDYNYSTLGRWLLKLLGVVHKWDS